MGTTPALSSMPPTVVKFSFFFSLLSDGAFCKVWHLQIGTSKQANNMLFCHVSLEIRTKCFVCPLAVTLPITAQEQDLFQHILPPESKQKKGEDIEDSWEDGSVNSAWCASPKIWSLILSIYVKS